MRNKTILVMIILTEIAIGTTIAIIPLSSIGLLVVLFVFLTISLSMYRLSLHKRTEGVSVQGVLVFLILFLALGKLWDNISLFNISTYIVSTATILAFLLLVFGFWYLLNTSTQPRLVSNWTVFAFILWIFLSQGILEGTIGNYEWIKSFVMLSMNIVLVIVSTKVRISQQKLLSITKFIVFLCYIMGFLGVFQFFLSNMHGMPVNFMPLPETMLRRDVYHLIDDAKYRFGGLIRSQVFSSEPSYYGQGMVILTTICLTLNSLHLPVRMKPAVQWGAVAAGLIGIVTSASFVALGTIALVLGVWLVTVLFTNKNFSVLQKGGVVFLVAGAVMFGAIYIWPAMEERLELIYSREDTSANGRVFMSLSLLAQPGDNLVTSLFGSGLGLETQSVRLWEEYEKYGLTVQRADKPFTGLYLWNGFAYIAVTMGWSGIIFFSTLIFVIYGRKNNLPISTFHLLALLILYQFSGTIYASDWWGLLIFVGLLRQADIESPVSSVEKKQVNLAQRPPWQYQRRLHERFTYE